VLHLPDVPDGVRFRQVGEPLAELQLAANIIIESGDIRGGNGGGLRIVSGLLRQRVNGWAGEAAVQTARGEVFVALQVVVELAGVDAQVGFEDIGNRQASVLVQLVSNGLAGCLGQLRALGQS
jgi:hypothetical protein